MSFEFLKERVVKHCRKPHVCIWCGGDIAIKTSYTIQVGLMDGDFQANEYHPECYEAMRLNMSPDESEFEPYSYKRGTADYQ